MSRRWEDRAAFCIVCGAPLHRREAYGRPRKCCTRCDYVQFRSPACAAGVVVARGREVLLIRRGIEPYRGAWGIPAGFQDYDEEPEAAAVREVREETGLEVRLHRLLAVCYTRDDPRNRVNVAIYLGEAVAGELAAADDAVAACYFSLDALPEPIAFDNNRAVLRELRRQCPTGSLL